MISKNNFPRSQRAKDKGKTNKNVTKKQVEDMIKGEQEVKFIDVVNATTISYAGTVIALSDVGNGTTNITRIGNSIIPRKLELRLTMSCADAYNVMRVIIFRWGLRFSVDPPDASDILELVSSTNAVNSPYAYNERSAYKIIFDQVYTMVLSQSDNIKYANISLKMKQKAVNYFGASTSDIMNGYYVLFISDSSVTTHPGMNYYSRLTYTDS